MTEVLDRAEIACHQFVKPLRASEVKQPGKIQQLAVAAVSGKVWFRVGWTCTCLKRVLESSETEMLLLGQLDEELDIYQLMGGAAASAGTHSKPGAADLGQTSDGQITTLRKNGGDFQKRTPAQGFVLHAHGWAHGCPHGSSGLLYQKRVWNNKDDGLVSHGTVQGLWPTQNWQDAVKERSKIIMALKDDLVSEMRTVVRAEVGKAVAEVKKVPGAVWAHEINISSDPKKKVMWTADHVLSHVDRQGTNLSNLIAGVGRAVDTLATAVAAVRTKIGA